MLRSEPESSGRRSLSALESRGNLVDDTLRFVVTEVYRWPGLAEVNVEAK